MKITGTMINYYFHCKRQCWLFSNRINLEDNSEDVKVGKILHLLKSRENKTTELSIDNIKIDRITDDYLVEIKKSDSDIRAVKWQVLLYLKVLQEKGIYKKGKIEIIEKKKQDKKIHYIDLDKEKSDELEKVLEDIQRLISDKTPPEVLNEAKCKRCAYYEYCYI